MEMTGLRNCEFAKTCQVAVTEDEHIKRIKERIGDIQWEIT